MGEGLALDWAVIDVGPADWSNIQWMPDGRIGRPFPARAAEALGLPPDVPTVAHTIRPPYWRPPQTESDHGGFGRAMRTVIAPWVRQLGAE